jgi:hypothetical protein
MVNHADEALAVQFPKKLATPVLRAIVHHDDLGCKFAVADPPENLPNIVHFVINRNYHRELHGRAIIPFRVPWADEGASDVRKALDQADATAAISKRLCQAGRERPML